MATRHLSVSTPMPTLAYRTMMGIVARASGHLHQHLPLILRVIGASEEVRCLIRTIWQPERVCSKASPLATSTNFESPIWNSRLSQCDESVYLKCRITLLFVYVLIHLFDHFQYI